MAEDTKNPKDVVCLGPDLGDGSHLFVRQREEQVDYGVFKPMKDGESADEFVELSYRGPGPIFESKTLYKRPTSDGPAMVNSREYTSGWDRIFGSKQEVGEA